MTRYGMFVCSAYHGGVMPPLATVDWGRRIRVPGIPGEVRFLCDMHARGLKGWRDVRRMTEAPPVHA